MAGLLESLKRLFSKASQKQTPEEIEALRADFQLRYHHFKLLLNANNKALEIMSDMEHALRGAQSFGMSFVKASSTAALVNVMQIVRNLDKLAPERYLELYQQLARIQGAVNGLLEARATLSDDRLVIPLSEVDRTLTDQVGAKMANLGEIMRLPGHHVPQGFVVTATAYRRFMAFNDLQDDIDALVQAGPVDSSERLFQLSADIQQKILKAEIPSDLASAILSAHADVRPGPCGTVSLRSSALGEDLAGTSFAGQYKSSLHVSREHLLTTYLEIVASKYGVPAMSYRLNRGIRDEDVAMCVGCMAMVPAVAGGVLYSRHPLHVDDDSVVINAVPGLPKSVVDGSTPTDLFILSRHPAPHLTHQTIAVKRSRLVCGEDEGLVSESLSEEEASLPAIDAPTSLRLAALALELEALYGGAQDIEWALDLEGNLQVLQCRPLKQLSTVKRRLRDVDAPLRVQGGVTASPGVACGVVFPVLRNADLLSFPEGAVLLVAQPLPRWASVLGKASAVVAEQGGVTGHLASVAREFGLPALFSVDRALEALPPGELVTVDADGQSVYSGRVEELLEEQAGSSRPMEGSPVYEILRQVGEHVIPLTLLDPDAPEFAPSSCKTLHDITRFCHEKSVSEMFQFGREHRFSERSSKQIVAQVPMQLWVINLDDGFREEVTGRFVPLENIVSIPMRALWEGMHAFPWQGPPPVDAKGLMAVMFQATANPELDPAASGRFSDRNYFMISRHFCSLQSRFGFHFCSAEALVGERKLENYASFSFKGGAADYARRRTRVEFVAGLLQDHGFRTTVREDALSARIEGYDQTTMQDRLKVLGYLIVHTRQLDMIMQDAASVARYRARMSKELKQLLEPATGASSDAEPRPSSEQRA